MAGLDITPRHTPGRQVIQAYGDGGFRIAGTRHQGSVIVFPDRTLAWSVTDAGAVDDHSLDAVIEAETPVEVLIAGCGRELTPPPMALRDRLREAGVVLEWMTTDAACRTFNVLLSEDRAVAAALIAIP